MASFSLYASKWFFRAGTKILTLVVKLTSDYYAGQLYSKVLLSGNSVLLNMQLSIFQLILYNSEIFLYMTSVPKFIELLLENAFPYVNNDSRCQDNKLEKSKIGNYFECLVYSCLISKD